MSEYRPWAHLKVFPPREPSVPVCEHPDGQFRPLEESVTAVAGEFVILCEDFSTTRPSREGEVISRGTFVCRPG